MPNVFQPKYRRSGRTARKRDFDSKSFFLSVVQLVAGCNNEGFVSALVKAFESIGQDDRPSKSAFCQYRQSVDYSFFQDALKNLQEGMEPNRKKFMGLYVYAIDGQQLTLPRTKDIVDNGFNGRAVSKYRESHYPKGFLTHAYDVLNGLTKGLTFNPTLHEQADARHLLQAFERESLTIYDRLYFSTKMARAHFEHGSYFLFRCRSTCHKTVVKLLASKKKTMTGVIGGHRIHFVKIRVPKSKSYNVYATNLPKRFVDRKLINQLYRMRWEVETSFKELTSITKAEQWHSKSYNGVMQELYALLWLINATKSMMRICGDLPKDPTKRVYRKANFKLIFRYFADHLAELWYRFRSITARIRALVKESTERRKRCSRAYPRQLKCPASPYSYNNTEWFWDKGYSLN